ncbi:hypothetical protein RhiirC2_803047 [Rhizophagus irregularis]|uniref:Uncharacterized protein n=1 Tax=Rhizophagus irregularis TaxID=588596 RepID=A0A2N1M0M9_9GLOM|nr:hypothetical protein RhiirC2_803047 [Rhizophagus irregularis]
MDKKEELMQMRNTLSSVQKTLSEKKTVLQEINTYLAEQILKTFSESEMLEACIHHLCNSITNHIHLMKSRLCIHNPICRRTKRQDYPL